MKKMQIKYESGRSMIEIIGVLAVTGLLTAGGFLLVNNGMASQKRSRAIDEINILAATARSLSAGTGNFSTIGGGAVVTSGDVATSKILGRTSEQAKIAQAALKEKDNYSTPLGKDSYYILSGVDSNFTVWVIDIDEDLCRTMEIASFADSTYVKCSKTNKGFVLTVNYNK